MVKEAARNPAVALSTTICAPTFPRQVGMRAIPVRCLALDNVSAAFAVAAGGEEARAEFDARTEEGKAAANKINKVCNWVCCCVAHHSLTVEPMLLPDSTKTMCLCLAL